MIYRKYEGRTYQEALLKMKCDFPNLSNGYISHSRNYKKGGFLGLGAKNCVEITVAIPEHFGNKAIELSKPKKEV